MSEYVMDYSGWAEGIPAVEYLKVCDAMHARKREEIVRCRDCKYMHVVRQWTGIDMPECWLHASRENALGRELTEPDGFCSWGERRDA